MSSEGSKVSSSFWSRTYSADASSYQRRNRGYASRTDRTMSMTRFTRFAVSETFLMVSISA